MFCASSSLALRPGRNGTNCLESGSSDDKRNSETVYIEVTVSVKSLPECATVDSDEYVILKFVIIYEYSSESLVSLHHTTRRHTPENFKFQNRDTLCRSSLGSYTDYISRSI